MSPGDRVVVATGGAIYTRARDMVAVADLLEDRGITLVMLRENCTFAPGSMELKTFRAAMQALHEWNTSHRSEAITLGLRAKRARGGRYSNWLGYTHAWRVVPRSDWSGVSVLASCETPGQVREADRRGYAAALIVAEHPADGRAYPLAGAGGFKVLPCPEQTRAGVTCATCRLCMDADRLHARKLVVGFAAHGSAARQVRFALNMLNG